MKSARKLLAYLKEAWTGMGQDMAGTRAPRGAAAEKEEEHFAASHEYMRRAGAPALYGAGAGLLAATAALLYRRPTAGRRLAAGAALGAGAGLVLIGAGARRSGRRSPEEKAQPSPAHPETSRRTKALRRRLRGGTRRMLP